MSLQVENDFIKNWLINHNIKRSVSIRQSGLISAPLTFGFFHAVILMPKTTDWKNEKMLEYVLEHEFVHIKSFDTIKKLFLTLALCVHWFNPLVWAMYILANRDIELACDEKVIKQFGTNKKSDYARILISMEQIKSGITPLCNNFNKNAVEERIEAIMKTKKRTILSVILATSLIVGTTTVFATSAKSNDNEANETSLVPGLLTTYTTDGKTYYVLGDGRTLEESEYLKEYPTANIEWWTYEEFKEWLEEQKKELPNIIGEKGWANGKEFVWTQEKIDEAIAMYEKMLEEIKNGAMYSKTIDGKDELLMSVNNTATETQDKLKIQVNEASGKINLEEYKQYEKYGMKYNENEQRFYYNGKLVRKFTDIKDSSGTINGFSFDSGDVDIEAKRDSSNSLIGLEVLSKEKFDENTNRLRQMDNMNIQSFEGGYTETADDTLKDYISYGIVYNNNKKLWQYNDKDIYIFYDEQGQKLIQGNAENDNNISLEVKRGLNGKIEKLSIIPSVYVKSYAKELME